MDDEQILARGGDEYEIAEYAKEHGATDPTNPILKAHLGGVEMFNKEFVASLDDKALGYSEVVGKLFGDKMLFWKKESLESFLTTYGTNLLKAAKEAGPGEKTIYPITNRENEAQIWRDGNVRGFNSCLTSFTSAIDEGIKGIGGGG